MICPLSFVDAHEPANAVLSLTVPEGATSRWPRLLPGQAAQIVLPVSGRDAARDRQIPHDAGGLYVPEQSPHIAAAVMDRPEMVWPCPSKVPPKVGMGVKSVPVRSMSASR